MVYVPIFFVVGVIGATCLYALLRKFGSSLMISALLFTLLAPLPYQWCFDGCNWIPSPLVVPGFHWIYFPYTLAIAAFYFIGFFVIFLITRYFCNKNIPQDVNGYFRRYFTVGMIFVVLAIITTYAVPLIYEAYRTHKLSVAEKSCDAAPLNAKFSEINHAGYDVSDSPRPLPMETDSDFYNTDLVYKSMRAGTYGLYATYFKKEGDENGTIDDISILNYNLTSAQSLAAASYGERTREPFMSFSLVFDKCMYRPFDKNDDNQIFCFQKDVLKFKQCLSSGDARPDLSIDDDFFIEMLNSAYPIKQ